MEIIMYTKNNCPNCKRAEFMFSACPTEVNLIKKNVEVVNDYMEELKELDSITLPTLVINGNVYKGFEENLGKIQEELGL